MKTISILILLVLGFASSIVFAEEKKEEAQKKSYVGVLVGPLIGTKNASTTEFAWGGRIGTAIGPKTWAQPSLGLSVATDSSSANSSGVSVNSSATAILAELIDRQVAESGFYFGARAGISLASADVSAGGNKTSGTGTAFTFAPVVGYEFDFTPQLALDLDASWITFTSYTVSFDSGTTLSIPTTQGIALLGGLVYRW